MDRDELSTLEIWIIIDNETIAIEITWDFLTIFRAFGKNNNSDNDRNGTL